MALITYTPHKFKKLLSIIVPALAGTMMLLSCKPDIESIKALSDRDSTPSMVAYNNEVIYTEGGVIVVKMTAPVTKHFQFAQEPYTEFPEGISVYNFSSEKTVESYLTAKYAIYYDKKKLWDARYNVVAMNKKGEILNTEQLFWDEQKKLIYSNDMVKITSAEGTIFGEGFEADEQLENIVVKKSSGIIYFDESPKETE
jgi:LPS export ABC transporter protein LptC